MKIPFVEPTSRPVGAAPLFRQMADDIDLVGIVNRMVRWDTRQSRVSPGERILLLVLDLLSGKSPLYRVADRLTATDVAVLIGAGRQAGDFTDDSLGRALDKLHRAEPAKVFSTLTMQAYAHEGIALQSGHFDTTSRTLHGDFADAAHVATHPAYGHSKDHRPDLKQILLTLFVNGHGVPLFGSVASGNQSDKTLNRAMIDRLIEALSPDQLRDLIYVADSALVTGPNLARLAAYNLQFISRCPETFGMTAKAKTAAWAAGAWIELGTVADRRDAAQYWASEQSGEFAGQAYRLVVYRSNTWDQRRANALDREIGAHRKALEQAARALEHQQFACEADAQIAWQQWLARERPRWHGVAGSVSAHTVHARPGRPRKTPDPAEVQTVWRVTVTLGALDAAQRQQELERRSTFVLITTVASARLSARDLLREYKGQVHVERHFHFLKDPLFVDALYVKKPERVEALGYVILMACLLYSLVERRLRVSAVPIPSPVRRVLTRPTGHEVVRHLQSLQVVLTAAGERLIALPPTLHATLEALLEALHMSPTIFTNPPLRRHPDP